MKPVKISHGGTTGTGVCRKTPEKEVPHSGHGGREDIPHSCICRNPRFLYHCGMTANAL
jgi:hypothetical protein